MNDICNRGKISSMRRHVEVQSRGLGKSRSGSMMMTKEIEIIPVMTADLADRGVAGQEGILWILVLWHAIIFTSMTFMLNI